MKMNKEKMMGKLEKEKDLVKEVWSETDIDEVGNVLCAINDIIIVIEKEEK